MEEKMPLIKKADVPQYFAARRAMKRAALQASLHPDGMPVPKTPGADEIPKTQK
jgi:hypothetical protein